MSCTLLLVEDMDDVRELTKAVFEERGYTVVDVPGGRDALQWLAAHEPPCRIFLDLMMPDMTGWELAELLAANPAWAKIPIVVVSASTAPKDRPIVARAFLKKPVPVERLLAETNHCQLHSIAHAS